MYDRLMLFTGRVSWYLSRKILRVLRQFPGMQHVHLQEPEVVKFANENLKVKLQESVRGADVFVVQTAACSWHAPAGVNPDRMDLGSARELTLSESLMELLVMVDALKGASAGRITIVTPYYPYVRSDKKDEPRISITARLIAQLFERAGADRVLTVNLHNLQIQGFAPMPCDQLDANPLIAEYFRHNFDMSKFGVLATDAGGVKWATVYAEMLKVPLAVCDKRRWADNEDPEIRNVIGIDEILDREVAVFDDEILTGGTITSAIRVLRERFSLPVSSVSCVHGVFAAGAIDRLLEAGVQRIVTTDSLPSPEANDHLHTVSIAPLLAAAIRNIHTSESVTQIFDQAHFLFAASQGDLWND